MKRKKGGVPEKETLREYLQAYEAQSKEFKDDLNFQGLYKIKERKLTKEEQHGKGRFYLSIFDRSPKCPVKIWVKELDNFMQQHQVSEIEAIKVVALHFEGKAYACWLFESFSLNNANTPTYARFIEILIERFDEAPCVSSSVDIVKPP